MKNGKLVLILVWARDTIATSVACHIKKADALTGFWEVVMGTSWKLGSRFKPLAVYTVFMVLMAGLATGCTEKKVDVALFNNKQLEVVIIHTQVGDDAWEKAVLQAKNNLDTAPKTYSNQIDLGMACVLLQRWREACVAYRGAYEVTDDAGQKSVARMREAYCLLHQKKDMEAGIAINEAANLDPTNKTIAYMRLAIWKKNGDSLQEAMARDQNKRLQINAEGEVVVLGAVIRFGWDMVTTVGGGIVRDLVNSPNAIRAVQESITNMKVDWNSQAVQETWNDLRRSAWNNIKESGPIFWRFGENLAMSI